MVSAVIAAGGRGRRMGKDINKLYLKIRDYEVLALTLKAFDDSIVDEIILVLPFDEIDFVKNNIINKYKFKKIRSIVEGGESRGDSVYRGLLAIEKKSEVVLIHDGARPFVDNSIIEECTKGALEFGACAAAVPVKDTIKVVSDGFVKETPDRKFLYAVQTPQAFRFDIIFKAYEEAKKRGINATDDTMLAELLGYKVKLIKGSYFNLKVTTPEDIIISEAIFDYLKKGGLI